MILIGGDYEHTLDLGRTTPEGELAYQATTPDVFFDLVLGRASFDACEFSLANTMMYHASGDHWLAAIPVFPSRVFRQSHVTVRKDSTLHDLGQLAGRRVGLRDYSQTAAVWLRGHLMDDHGVDWRDIEWVSGLDQRFATPAGARLTQTGDDLEDLLVKGEIDALMLRPLRDFRRPPAERRLRPLIDDPDAFERAFLERTRIFPIMHTVVVHRDVLDAHPWWARAIFDAYAAAKKTALSRRLGTTFIPWTGSAWTGALALFGGDSHPYGLTPANRRTIELFAGYLHEQNLAPNPVDIDSMFVPGSLDWRE